MKIKHHNSEWDVLDTLKRSHLGEEARSRVMDFVRWVLKTPDPETDPRDHEEWELYFYNDPTGSRMPILTRETIGVRFDVEGYCTVEFHGQPHADELIEKYYELQLNS